MSLIKALLVVGGLLSVATSQAMDWKQWRGPESNAYVAEGDYPAQLSLEENLVWSIDLPGPGSSTPIILNDTIYTTCEIDGQDTLCAYDANGKQLWQKILGPGSRERHRSATGANPAPTTDGKLIYAYFKSGLLIATTLEGEEKWRVNLQEKFGEYTIGWDLGTSPLLTEKGLLVAVMQTEGSYLATFDCQTGELLWKVERELDSPGESKDSYSTPLLTTIDGKQTVIIFGADHLTGHSPADGKELFRLGGFNPQQRKNWRTIASSTISNGVVVIPFGRSDFLTAVRLSDLQADVANEVNAKAIVWEQEQVGADVACPIIAGDKVYNLGDRGLISCLDFATGETLWTGQLPRSRTKCFSSPLLLGDLLYCFREDGTGHVGRLTDTGWELLSTVDVEESVVTQPVPFGENKVLIRSRNKLLLFGSK